MRTVLVPLAAAVLFPVMLAAQSGAARYNFDLAGTAIFGVSGWKIRSYSPGFGLRAGSELRMFRHFGAEAGLTQTWVVATHGCSRFGCTDSREGLRLADYGVRGIVPVGNRLEVSAGVGGGYVWHPFGSPPPFGPNEHLLQYSGHAAFVADRSGQWRVTFGIRTGRDLGRPTQQWLSTTMGVRYGLGKVR